MGDFLSVVIPAYNEESRIPPTLEKLHRYLKDRYGDFEIIVVDDGSSDNTPSAVENLGQKLDGIRLVRYAENRGKGYAVRTGVLASRGTLVLMCDADLSTPIEEIEKLKRFIRDGFAVAIGSRGLKESDILERQPWYRENMGKMFNLFVRILVTGGIHDTQCGFKLFRGDIARELFSKSLIDGFSFDVESLFLAKESGYTIKEVPVRWINSPTSRVRIMSDPVKMFLELFQIKVNSLLGRYNRTVSDSGKNA
jgi:dolichyl-phosphate beta-glucosyltransferase